MNKNACAEGEGPVNTMNMNSFLMTSRQLKIVSAKHRYSSPNVCTTLIHNQSRFFILISLNTKNKKEVARPVTSFYYSAA